MHCTKLREPSGLAEELVQLVSPQPSPVHHVEPLPVLSQRLLPLGVVQQASLEVPPNSVLWQSIVAQGQPKSERFIRSEDLKVQGV